MNNGYLVGGLAIVGAVALFAYLTPKGTRRNSDGFFGASGRGMMSGGGTMGRGTCAFCRNSRGDTYHTGENRTCRGRDVCHTFYGRNSQGFYSASGRGRMSGRGMMSGGSTMNKPKLCVMRNQDGTLTQYSPSYGSNYPCWRGGTISDPLA